MKKFLLPALIATLALTACNKPADTPAEPKADTAPVSTPDTNNTPTPPEQHAQDKAHDHAHGEAHTHDHAEHGHAHDHAHEHHEGDKYQCGDKTVHISVHDHEGEMEAHLTADNVQYDLASDVQTKGRYTTNDSIQGDDKGMALTLDGDKATITTLDDKAILDCTKTNS